MSPEPTVVSTPTPPPATPPTPKVFSQEEVNSLLAANKRELRTEIEDLRGSQEEIKTSVGTILERLPKPKGEEESEVKPGDVQGQLELLEKRYVRKLGEVQSELAEEKQNRETEHKKRLKSERNSELTQALTAAQCVDIPAAIKIFKDRCEHDGEQWMFTTEKGNSVSIHDGIKEELQDYLRRSRTEHGGSGAKLSNATAAAKQKEVEKVEKDLEVLRIAATESGRTSDRMAYERKKRELNSLKAQSTS